MILRGSSRRRPLQDKVKYTNRQNKKYILRFARAQTKPTMPRLGDANTHAPRMCQFPRLGDANTHAPHIA